jgi:hypothetical protein
MGNGARRDFHLHANRGLSDDHLSFPAADRLGIIGVDGCTGPWDCYQALAEIAGRFSTAIKVFVVPAGETLGNRDYVRRIAVLATAASA